MAKKQHIIYLDDELFEKIVAVYKLKNFRTISEFVDNTIREWFARDAGQESSMYMSRQLVAMVENALRMSEQRINRILFKIAVSDAEMKHVLVSGFKRIEPDFLTKIHDKSEREVRLENGILNLRKIVEEVQDERERRSYDE